MNKLLILLLLSTPLFAQDDLIVIEDKELANENIKMIFYSDGNYAHRLPKRINKKPSYVVTQGVWKRAFNYGNNFSNHIQVYYSDERYCMYMIDKIADTYIFRISNAVNDTSGYYCLSSQMLLKETEWSKANLPQKLDEYKMVD